MIRRSGTLTVLVLDGHVLTSYSLEVMHDAPMCCSHRWLGWHILERSNAHHGAGDKFSTVVALHCDRSCTFSRVSNIAHGSTAQHSVLAASIRGMRLDATNE